ncbi:phosphoenolpyruvate-protein phosphotransferase [Candidatus Protochlamydia naegleriophila]|uniref:Phosphoenolpyruvate-protein phosphotransferase n=1 Tax=Candidatus Protochlamydia naegleriophila TaxID=389348 RepID=A0A0U5ETG9_9BACT|nr:phosphoenolpyruvate--protein phosphotransferase [Candidatus Protochlamydia naegleriophila]CUI17489.1 phosphoenolpyruvate-protein phosphotransferase [Candidatus Protochlamydia naegleriophila]
MHVDPEEVILTGCPICRGIAIGKPFFLNRDEFVISERLISAADTEREVERYRIALSRSKQDIKRLQKQLESESALDGIMILEAQLEMLDDPLMTNEIEQDIRHTQKNAEFIFQQSLAKLQERFLSLKDSFFVERFKDVEDVSQRIFSYLSESGNFSLCDVPANSIVCAQELTASDAAGAQACYVGAFLTENGGVTSHAAIVAKAKGIPYISNISLDVIRENANRTMIVDGRTGQIILNPTEATLYKYELLKLKMSCQVKAFEEVINWPAQTYDGYEVRLHANLEVAHEIDLLHQLGGRGIGLFRSEYIFLPQNEIPSEEEQFHIYRNIIEQMNGLPVVIRTFDLGGDKASLHHSFSVERNPFLGCRATRFLLKEKTLLKSQLRAIARVSCLGQVSILFPMIATLSELKEAKKMLHEVCEELQIGHAIRVGCMIEVPSAALIVDHFVKECDFLSIGTNDLVQYALAIDRRDHTVNEFNEPTDPSVIRLIKLITTEANKAHVPVSVCGEIASDPRFTPLLLGLGIQELSVAPRYLPVIKNAIRSTSIVDAVHLADKALSLTTAHEVLELLTHEYQKNVPHDLFYNVKSNDA